MMIEFRDLPWSVYVALQPRDPGMSQKGSNWESYPAAQPEQMGGSLSTVYIHVLVDYRGFQSNYCTVVLLYGSTKQEGQHVHVHT